MKILPYISISNLLIESVKIEEITTSTCCECCKMSASKLDSTDCLHDIEKICQACGADPCCDTNWPIRKRNSNTATDITKPPCNCCKCIKCPVSVIKRLCQLALKNEERQNLSKERYSVFEGGRSLDFDGKPQVDERGDFIYQRKSKPADSSSDELKSRRDRTSSKEKSRRKFSTDGDSYYTSPDHKPPRRKRNERNTRTRRQRDTDNTTLTSEKDDNLGSKRKTRRKATKKLLYSETSTTEDVSSTVDKVSKKRKHSRLTGGETQVDSRVKEIQKSEPEHKKTRDEANQDRRKDEGLSSSKRSKLSTRAFDENRIEKNLKGRKSTSTVMKTENEEDPRISAGEGLSQEKKTKSNKHGGTNTAEKIAKDKPNRDTDSEIDITNQKKRKSLKCSGAQNQSAREADSDAAKSSKKRAMSKAQSSGGLVGRIDAIAGRRDRTADGKDDDFDPESSKRKNYGNDVPFDPESSKRKMSKRSNKDLTKEEAGRKSSLSRARPYGSKTSEEVIIDSSGRKKSFNEKVIQDITVYDQEGLRKSSKRKQLPKLSSPFVGSQTEKSKAQSTDGTGKNLTTRRKRSVEEKLKIIETLTPDLVMPQEQDENKIKSSRLYDGKNAEARGKSRPFRIPGHRNSMEGLGRGCRKMKCKLGTTRYDQFAFSDLMRMRLEAEDLRRGAPVSNKPQAMANSKCTTNNMTPSYTMKPAVHNIEINDACLPPPINPLAYCYM